MTHTKSDVFRVDKSLSGNFTMILNDNIRDPSVSCEAKLLHAIMLSFPDGWEYNLEHLQQFFKEGRDVVRRAMNELVQLNYVTRQRKRGENNKFAGYKYTVYEVPQPTDPAPENPATGNPAPEYASLINTDDINTELINDTELKDGASKVAPSLLLPIPPGTRNWPGDIKCLAVTFAKRFKRDPYPFEVSHWIKSLRKKYLPLGITEAELNKMYDIAERDKISIKSPDSLMYTLNSVRPPEGVKPQIIGTTQDGGLLMQYANGVVGTVYGD